MSDTDLPGSSGDQNDGGDEPTTAIPGTPAAADAPEPTTPLPGFVPPTPAVPPAPPAYQPPGYQAPVQQPPVYAQPQPPIQPPPYPTQFGSPQPAEPSSYPVASPSATPVAPERARLPRWTWPVIAVLSLVLGGIGGAIGASVGDDDTPTGGSRTGIDIPVRTAEPLPADNVSIAAVAAKLLPSTVQIIAEYKGRAQGATGSGFVFDNDGHVITNNHVVAEAAKDKGPIDVIDQKGKHHKATVVGRSPVYDLAVLKVEDITDLPAVARGSADQMRVGETVIAVGSPLALSATVTSGIVSAKNRPVTTGDGDDASFINAVQTDAAINPGNSGGPLANLQGQVIGVNSAIASIGSSGSDEAANIGVGFAIPIEQVLVTADQILRTGKAQYPVIGVQVRGTETSEGAEVKEINAGTPAAKSDLKVGDIITAVDGTIVTDQTDVVVAIRSHQVGDTVTLTVKRGGQTLKIKVGLLGKTG